MRSASIGASRVSIRHFVAIARLMSGQAGDNVAERRQLLVATAHVDPHHNKGSGAMKSLARSQAARRRAAAAAAVASVGGGYLGTQSAEAAIVSIDLTNVNGVNFTGVNAGLSAGDYPKGFDMSFGAAGTLQFNVYNK